MGYRSPWDLDEVIRARHLYSTGLTWEQVGQQMGRTMSSCRDAVARHYGRIENPTSYWDGPAIGLTQEDDRYRKDAKLGSAVLLNALLDLFSRTANRYQVSMDDAMACHLGYHARPVIPGTERIYRGQSAERLAA